MSREKKFFLIDWNDSAPLISGRKRHDWVEESFDTSGVTERPEYLGVSVSDIAIKILFSFIACMLVLFFLRTGYVQVLQGSGFMGLAERNKGKELVLLARRGIFYDRNGTPLVWNVPSFLVGIVKSELPAVQSERDTVIAELSKRIGVKKSEIEQALEKAPPYQQAIIAEDVPYESALDLETIRDTLPGVTLEISQRRSYEKMSGFSLSHVLGYTGRISEKELEEKRDLSYVLHDIVGKEGLELSYEPLIHGVHGKKRIEVDALGREKQVLAVTEPQDGKNLYLTIDKNLQEVAEKALEDSLKLFNKKKGVVIVSDPKDGGILAMVSLPSYDNNLFARGISQKEYSELIDNPDRPLFHRAVYGEYPSGSTIKMIVAAAGLQEKIATRSTTVRSVGGLRIGAWYFPDWKAGGHGVTNVVKAIAESVNTYFYMIGGGYGDFEGLGADVLANYFKAFGLGEKTNIDLVGERTGFIPTPEWKRSTKNEPWYIGDTYHIAIGQGDVLATPLQINTVTQYFASGGVSYRPHLVKGVESEEKGAITSVEPIVVKTDVVDRKNVEIVREGLRSAVEAGSARRLSLLGVTAAGKTGTAQWGSGAPHAWFTGFAPYEDPKIVVTVLVEQGEEGSRSATPVAYDILKWYFTKPPQKPQLQSSDL